MSLDAVNWEQTCCAWHGEYAEHPTKAGGVVRLKRDTDGNLLMMRFDSRNHVLDEENGEPVYVPTTADQLADLLADP